MFTWNVTEWLTCFASVKQSGLIHEQKRKSAVVASELAYSME
jgi:hypothetical protein